MKQGRLFPTLRHLFIVDNAERVEQLASTVQHVVVSAAVLVGGGWSLYEFVATQRVERARLELDGLRAREPVLNLSLSVPSPMIVPGASGSSQKARTLLHIVAKIENVGQANVVLDMTQPVLGVHQVVGSPHGKLVATSSEQLRVIQGGGLLSMRAGATAVYEFAAEAKGDGLYAIVLRLPVPASEIARYHTDQTILLDRWRADMGNRPELIRGTKLPPIRAFWRAETLYNHVSMRSVPSP